MNTVTRDPEELDRREKMINFIEGQTGVYAAVWHEWPTKQIEILYYNLKNRG